MNPAFVWCFEPVCESGCTLFLAERSVAFRRKAGEHEKECLVSCLRRGWRQMESTGVYWKPVWAPLESHFELILANPFQVNRFLAARRTRVILISLAREKGRLGRRSVLARRPVPVVAGDGRRSLSSLGRMQFGSLRQTFFSLLPERLYRRPQRMTLFEAGSHARHGQKGAHSQKPSNVRVRTIGGDARSRRSSKARVFQIDDQVLLL